MSSTITESGIATAPKASGPNLNGTRRRTLEAAVRRILPSDDGHGAAECGVARYIESALDDRFHAHLGNLFERGLDFIDAFAVDQYSKSFGDCEVQEMDEVLKAVQQFPNNDARRFFQNLIDLSIEGFLGDPMHGGNLGELGWDYVGLRRRAAGECWKGEA